MVCVLEPGGGSQARAGSTVSGTSQGKFPKSAHLLRHSDFRRVYENGKRHFSGNLTAFYLGREIAAGQSSVRVGFTVGKALGGSVERNRIRRRTREAVRHHLGDLAGMSGAVDMVLHPKKSVLNVDFAVLSEEVAKALRVARKHVEQSGKKPNPERNARSRETGPHQE